MVSEQDYPRQQMVWSDWCGWYVPSKPPKFRPALAADRPYSSSASARRPWPSRSIASSSSSLSGYGGGPYRQEMGVIGLGSSACKIPSRFQSESALEPYLPRQIPDSSDLRRRRGPAELALAVSGPDRREVKVPHPTPGKIPNPSSDLGKMKEWVVSYEEDATDPTAVWRILHLRPSEEPRKVPDQIQPRKMELETARRVEYPRQSNSNSTQGKQWMGAPEGNFNPPPTGHSAVLSGWGQNQLPPACLVSPNLNHLNPSHGPELAKQCSQYPRELRNQFQFQDQSKQWDPNPSNKRVLSVSTVDDDYSYFNNMKIEQLEQTKVKANLCSVEYQPRRVPGKEILEQEVYGIDPYTHNLSKEIVPADLDWSIEDKAEEKQGVNESGDEDTINKDIAVKTNFVMASVPDEAKFYLTQLYMVGRDDKWLWSTGLLWKPPPWPDFCAKGCDRVAHFNMKQGTFLYNFDARMLTQGYHCFSRRLMLEYSKFSSLDSDEPFACKLNNPKHRDTYKQVYVHILNYVANLWEKLPKLSMQFVGLFWNLPPWPDLNFCEDNWMANGMEKGAGTAAKKDAYNAVTWQSKIYSQQAKSKPFIEAGVKNETVSAASGTPSTDLIASGNKTYQRRFSPTKSGTGTFEYQNNSPGVATPPLEFCCPIFMKLISESVIIASGQTYGREKLSQFGHVPAANIFSLYEVSNIGHIPLLLWVARATLYDTLRVTVRIAMIGKLQDGTVFLKMVHDEEPFEIKIDEEEVIDGPEKVIRVWDPGTGPKNMKWLSSPLGVVGDIAEMGSDLFGSSEESSCAALVVASISSIGVSRYFTGMCYPLLVSSISIIVCLIATLLATDFLEIKVEKESEPALQKPLIIPTAFMTVGIAIFIWVALPAKFKSVNITIFVIAVSIYVSISVTAMYGLAVAVLDMLSTIATGLAIDAYGSISDKTGGIAERAGMSHRVPENAIGGIYGVLILKKGHKFEEVQRPGTSLYKIKTLMKCVKQLWLPVSHALLEMTISHFPSPSKTQKHRVENLYEGPLVDIYTIAIRKCDSEGPLMLYVFKLIPASDKGRFFAFGHVYSWRVATGMKVLIMGHNYVPGQSKDLYVMSVQHIVIWLGRKLKSVENDPCGNTVTVMGPDQFITKNTTLPNEKEVDACQMKSMKLYVSFAVHVAVQYKVTSDLPKLLVDSKSLAKPVLYTIEESGEPIITEAGELHLDICLKGLLKKFLWRRLILPRNISRIVGPDYQIRVPHPYLRTSMQLRRRKCQNRVF